MTKKLSDKLGNVFVTTNPQSSGLAGETIYYSGDTSGWEVIGGVTQQDGWALCDGAEVTQAEYPELFEAIGTAWNFGGETGFRLPTIPDVVGNPINAVAIVALYNNLASVVSTRDLSVNKLNVDTDLTVGTAAIIPDLTVTNVNTTNVNVTNVNTINVGATDIQTTDLTVNGTLTADSVVDSSGETITEVIGEVKASVLTEMQFQSLKGTGWVLADGEPISREVYADLFALIGETYGPGDGVNTFNLPDLRERYIRGTGAAEAGLGDFREDTTAVKNLQSNLTLPNATTNTTGQATWRFQTITGNSNQFTLSDNASPMTTLSSVFNNTSNIYDLLYGPEGSNESKPGLAHKLVHSSNTFNVTTELIPTTTDGETAAFNSPSFTATARTSGGFTFDPIYRSTGIRVNDDDVTYTTNLSGGMTELTSTDNETAPKSVILNYFIKIA